MSESGSTDTRVAIYGPGAMGLHITRLLLERGTKVVAAIGRPGSWRVGKDLGTLAGVGPLDVPVRSDAEQTLKETKPDVVVVTVGTYLDPVMYDIFATAVRAGANVITLAEEMLYPFPTSTTQAKRLDELAKLHGVTVTGTGHQDAYWVGLVSLLTGSAHTLRTVEGSLAWNVDDFGPTVAQQQLVGRTAAEFTAWLDGTTRKPTFGRVSLYALAASIGLTPSRATTKTTAVIATKKTRCRVLDSDVPAGRVLGYTDTDTLHTEEGVDLIISSTGKVYDPTESDFNKWRTTGAPSLQLCNDGLFTPDTTCATLVNRIPDVVDAPPGIVTIDRLPPLRHRPASRATSAAPRP